VLVADWVVDATFRALVGLETAEYWVIETRAGAIWIADPPPSIIEQALGPFTVELPHD
jgi:hypothetical protein